MHDQLNIANTGVSGLRALCNSLNLDISVELEYFEQEDSWPEMLEEGGGVDLVPDLKGVKPFANDWA